MDWYDLKMKSDRISPDTSEFTHVEANSIYDKRNDIGELFLDF